MKKMTRREFVGAVGAAALTTLGGCSIVPRHVVARSGKIPPSERLNIAGIGAGGQGGQDIKAVANSGGNIIALCDVDEERAAETFQMFSSARRFKDYRRLLDAMDKDIDGVIVGTPDHTHAVIAMAAMERGKHVYCEKPLAHSIHEVRALMKAAERYNVVTQLGNQGHSFDSCRIFREWIQDGAIGNVHTIHCGCSAINSGLDKLAAVQSERPDVPATLDWNLWQGPAQERAYHPAFVQGRWRYWVPYGNGTIGDWACHVVDPVFWALDLGAPATIQAKVKDYDFKTQGLAYPKGEVITFEFPAKGKRGPVTLYWYSGTESIPRPPEMPGNRIDIDVGAAVYGDKGTIIYGSHGASGVRLIPEEKMHAYKRPAPSIPRVKEHHAEWLNAIREGRKADSDFSYGGPLTEIALVGIIAIKMNPMKLEWDGRKGRFTNSDEANQFLNPPYRHGWKLA